MDDNLRNNEIKLAESPECTKSNPSDDAIEPLNVENVMEMECTRNKQYEEDKSELQITLNSTDVPKEIPLEIIEKSVQETPACSDGSIPAESQHFDEPPAPAHSANPQSFIVVEDQLRMEYEQQLEQVRSALLQKDNMIALLQRENGILEKEKESYHKDKELANKEKESIVIKFAMKEKLLLDAKREKEFIEKQLADSRKEVKNVSSRFHALNEEKARMTHMIDEKCNELRKQQREYEKLKSECGHLESKLKYHINKLNIETEAKQALEKKLDEEKNSSSKLEEKANEQIKMEYEANTILLRHEIEKKDKDNETLKRDHIKLTEKLKQLQEQLSKEQIARTQLAADLDSLHHEHESVQNAYSEEMLNSAKLRGQLDELELLRTQNTLNEEKIATLIEDLKKLDEKLLDILQDLEQVRAREQELLSLNKEISESMVDSQNEICLLKGKILGIEAENELLVKKQLEFDTKYSALQTQLEQEKSQRAEERKLLTKHLSEKTKLNETIKIKLDNVLGDLEATKKKHSQVVKELKREINKYKKNSEEYLSTSPQCNNTTSNVISSDISPPVTFPESIRKNYCSQCQKSLNGTIRQTRSEMDVLDISPEGGAVTKSHSEKCSKDVSEDESCRQLSNSSETDTTNERTNPPSATYSLTNDLQGPSKKHLVERILRLQKASARQTEKIDFLENHTLSLVAELQKKSKVVQYYMLRDQVGALTSNKSDEHKSELTKYGGVMAAIYGGIKNNPNQSSMTLELSLEINKKLQAVLEDTLLKNITLKENLDVLGLEVDKLTRKLALLESKE